MVLQHQDKEVSVLVIIVRVKYNVKWKNCAGNRGTFHYEGCKAFVLPSLIYDLAGIFPAMSRFTCRNPESGLFVQIKRSLDFWILWDPVLILLPLYRERQRTFHDAAKDHNISQNSGDIFYLLNKCWRD